MPLTKLGFKRDESNMPEVAQSNGEDKVYYPSFSIDHNVPDDIMGSELDEKIRCEVVLKVTRKSIDSYDGKDRKCIGFDVLAIGPLGKAGRVSKDEFLNMEPKEREKYQEKSVMSEDEEDY